MRLNSIKRLTAWAIVAASALSLGACVKEETIDTDALIQEALDGYMAGLSNVYRQKGGYWVEPIDLTSKSGVATNDGECWVRYNFTSRSLDEDLCNTRYEAEARQQGSFNYKTYYSPISLFLTEDWGNKDYKDYSYNYFYHDMVSRYTNDDFAMNMAFMSKELTIDGAVVDLYEGNKFKVYMPYNLRGAYYNGYSGYAGSTKLGEFRPMVNEVEIVEVVTDSKKRETDMLTDFMANNSGDWVQVQYDVDGTEDAQDVEGLFINYDYTPETTYTFTDAYNYGEMPMFTYYGIEGIDELDAAINTELLDEYGAGESDGEEVGTKDEAYIWYILRTLDGFIVDTNIKAVSERAFGDTSGCGTALEYKAERDHADYINAWFYAIPKLKYGAWASILTTSANAYGATGGDNTRMSTEIAPNTPLIFSVYLEEFAEEWE